MSNIPSQRFKINLSWSRFLPYLVFGAFVFSLNSLTSLNYLMRGYLVLLESQVGIIALYFIIARLKDRHRLHSSSKNS